jgi:hypothetical protein
MNTGQKKNKCISGIQNKISYYQAELRNKISAIRFSQSELEEEVIETLDKQLNDVMTVARSLARSSVAS